MNPLLRNITTEGSWPLQGEVFFRLFETYIEFAVEDAATVEYVERCAEYLNSLSETVVDEFCLACIRYREDYSHMIGDDIEELENHRDVLELIEPTTLIVPNPEHGDEAVVHMELNCDWDIEHGIELIVRKDKVLYVGGFNGQSPWSDYSKRQSWNYASGGLDAAGA